MTAAIIHGAYNAFAVFLDPMEFRF